MKWLIAADSACDLRTLNLQGTDAAYVTVPMRIIADEYEYIDDGREHPGFMLEALRAGKGLMKKSSTACPSPNDWVRVFEMADQVIAITAGSRISASYDNALAAEELVKGKYPDKKIAVVDSRGIGPFMSLLVYKAKELVKEDIGFEEAQARLLTYGSGLELRAVLASTENLSKRQKIEKRMKLSKSKETRVLADMSGIFRYIGKSRSLKDAGLDLLTELANAGLRDGRVMITYNGDRRGALVIANMIHVSFPESHISMMEMGGVCSYYFEDGILVAFEGL